MNFQELNELIEALKKDKKGNKELITFYKQKRTAILTKAIQKGFNQKNKGL
jgi:hypothetical protein